MNWAKVKFSKSKVDKAGKILIDKNSSERNINLALEVLNNWRASHSYPMHIFKKRLKSVSQKIDKKSLSVQRLKRVPSIIKKLKRVYKGNKPTMKLSQMQDIAGCRAVISNVRLVNKLYNNYYLKGDIKHKRIKENNYIISPKKDGYRSIHLIYKYNTDRKGKEIYNGLLVEIQIRSKLQHIWATAVEIVDFFTRQGIKFNKGKKEWVYFFKLVSSAFAKIEKCPPVPDTPNDDKILYLQIKEAEKKLQVIKKMEQWTKSIRLFETAKKPNSHFFLLELDYLQEKLSISSYPKNEEEKAISDYNRAEKVYRGMKEYDVVLVGADDTGDLRKAYPNYFVDTKEFLDYLKKILKKLDKF